MAKLPKKIKVAAFDMSIEPMSISEAHVRNRWGEFTALTQTIRIEDPFPHQHKHLDTTFHELLHAIYWAYGIEEGDNEERTVSTIATGLTQVLRDNPKLVKFITDVLNEK